jgi:predicted transcriptional regulator
MVAPAYSEKRRELAKEIGLGRKPGQKRGRRKKASAGNGSSSSGK